MRIADSQLESVLVADHVRRLQEDHGSLPLRLRLGRWLVVTGLRLAPEFRPVT
jgi:hypothetical protein